ncbi:MAG: phosphotransferase [Deltaproteobacteria bacterium]|nr:phosphotransferase [Deltaproteobacteria bacterium]
MRKQLRLSNENLPDYLVQMGLFRPGQDIHVEAAGDGNINWVRRAFVPGEASYIVKQARPALEKFPEYEVTTERLIFEARYLERVRPVDDDHVCPEVVRFDPDERVLVLEDLRDATRLDAALRDGRDVTNAMETLTRFLARVHTATADDPGLAAAFENDAMRRLHGDHIFVLPYEEAFPAPPATAKRAAELRADQELVAIARTAYDAYLRPEGPLVHADVQASNILLDPSGPKLLDAEISHAGDPAFDLGTLLAHLAMPAAARGEADAAMPLLQAASSAYRNERGADASPPNEDVMRYAGLELIRRTIGAARVSCVEEDEAGLEVLALGTEWARGR